MIAAQKVKIKIDGKDQDVLAQKVENHIWIYYRGRTYALPLDNQKKGRRKSELSTGDAKIISAPMPGKITKLLFSEGQLVEAGKVVVVMEAMKMEYTLKAESVGKIKKVNIKIGDQVSLGQLLIEFESDAKKDQK